MRKVARTCNHILSPPFILLLHLLACVYLSAHLYTLTRSLTRTHARSRAHLLRQTEQLLRAEEEDERLLAAIEGKRGAKEQLVGIIGTLAIFCEVSE